jgi:hypothetical protein
MTEKINNDDLKKIPKKELLDVVCRILGLTTKESKKSKIKQKPEPLPDIFEGEH